MAGHEQTENIYLMTIEEYLYFCTMQWIEYKRSTRNLTVLVCHFEVEV